MNWIDRTLNILNLKILELQCKGYDVIVNDHIEDEKLIINCNITKNSYIGSLIMPLTIYKTGELQYEKV